MDDAERNLIVVFGPSRSRFFPTAVAYARAVATEVAEPEPGRYRAAFTLGADPDSYAHASALIERVRRWQGSEVSLGPIPLAPVNRQRHGVVRRRPAPPPRHLPVPVLHGRAPTMPRVSAV